MKPLLHPLAIALSLLILPLLITSCCSECEEEGDWGDWEELEELEDGKKGKKGARPKKTGGGAGGGACANFAGSYSITTKVDKRKCDGGVETKNVTLDFSQSGCTVTVPISITGAKLRGTARGDRVTLTGSYNEDGKITKKLNLRLKGDTISGSGTWTYSTAGYKCSGIETLSGSR